MQLVALREHIDLGVTGSAGWQIVMIMLINGLARLRLGFICARCPCDLLSGTFETSLLLMECWHQQKDSKYPLWEGWERQGGAISQD